MNDDVLLLISALCGSRKYAYLSHGRLLEISEGGGRSHKPKVFKLDWNFKRGEG